MLSAKQHRHFCASRDNVCNAQIGRNKKRPEVALPPSVINGSLWLRAY